jgi:hypothetical protein
MMVENPNPQVIAIGILSERIGQQAYLLDRWKMIQKENNPVNVDGW